MLFLVRGIYKKKMIGLYLWSSDILYLLRVLLWIIYLVMVLRKFLELVLYESLFLYKLGLFKNVFIILLIRRLFGGCEKCFLIVFKILRSLISLVFWDKKNRYKIIRDYVWRIVSIIYCYMVEECIFIIYLLNIRY